MHTPASLAAFGRQKLPFLYVVMVLATEIISMTAVARANDVDTEHLFGFTVGSDIGNVGEKELESETSGRFGKREGSYGALSQTLEAKYTPIRNVRIAGSAGVAHFEISGVPGLDDRRQAAFQGLSLDLRY